MAKHLTQLLDAFEPNCAGPDPSVGKPRRTTTTHPSTKILLSRVSCRQDPYRAEVSGKYGQFNRGTGPWSGKWTAGERPRDLGGQLTITSRMAVISTLLASSDSSEILTETGGTNKSDETTASLFTRIMISSECSALTSIPGQHLAKEQCN